MKNEPQNALAPAHCPILKKSAATLFSAFLLASAGSLLHAADPVTITDEGAAYTLANGIVTARVDKRNGNLTSLVYKDIETLGHASGHAVFLFLGIFQCPGRRRPVLRHRRLESL